MKIKVVLFLLLSGSTAAMAQSNVIKSPYLLGEEAYSIATVKGGLPLRERFDYNCQTQRMEFVDEEGVNRELADIATIDTVFLGSHKMIPYQQRFIEVFHKSEAYELKVDYKFSAANRGKMNHGLGIKTQASGIESIDLQSAGRVEQEDRYSNVEAWEYVPRHTYYIRIGKKTRHFNDKKSLLKLFPDKAEQIERALDSMKVSFAEPSEVNRLLQSLFE